MPYLFIEHHEKFECALSFSQLPWCVSQLWWMVLSAAAAASLICTLILQAFLICWLGLFGTSNYERNSKLLRTRVIILLSLHRGTFCACRLPHACKAVCFKTLRRTKPLNASVTPIHFVLDFQWPWADVSLLVSVELYVFLEKFRAAELLELCDDVVSLDLLMMINLFACLSVS